MKNTTCSPSVADHLVTTLNAWDVRVLLTIPGGALMPFLRACKRGFAGSIITCRHETAACMIAASYYHAGGGAAAVAVTSGPGVLNAANGLVHALREQASVFFLSARPATHAVGRGAVQDFDAARFLGTITKRSEQLLSARQVAFLADDLMRTALAVRPGPTNLTVAADQWALAVEDFK